VGAGLELRFKRILRFNLHSYLNPVKIAEKALHFSLKVWL
jgi:hypothetical protein